MLQEFNNRPAPLARSGAFFILGPTDTRPRKEAGKSPRASATRLGNAPFLGGRGRNPLIDEHCGTNRAPKRRLLSLGLWAS